MRSALSTAPPPVGGVTVEVCRLLSNASPPAAASADDEVRPGCGRCSGETFPVMRQRLPSPAVPATLAGFMAPWKAGPWTGHPETVLKRAFTEGLRNSLLPRRTAGDTIHIPAADATPTCSGWSFSLVGILACPEISVSDRYHHSRQAWMASGTLPSCQSAREPVCSPSQALMQSSASGFMRIIRR